MTARGPVFRILVVCTGNQCRSPAAERLLVQHLVTSQQSRFELDSAGTAGVQGVPMHPCTVAALQTRGVAAEGHEARTLTRSQVTQADLVLTAERSHRLFVAQVDAEARGRTFTLTEFDRLAIVALRIGVLNPWELVAAAAALRGQFLPADPTEDDLPDPVQGSPGQHEAIVARIDSLTAQIAASLVASAQQPVFRQVKGRRAALRW